MKQNNIIRENETKYGSEIKLKYGNEAVDNSYNKVKNMSEETFKRAESLSRKVLENLKKAYDMQDPTCEYALKAVEYHKEWLCLFYDGYSKDYHLNLANMYIKDKRFRKNYDVIGNNGTEFFKECIHNYFNCE